MAFDERRVDPQLRVLLPALPRIDITDTLRCRRAQQAAVRAAGITRPAHLSVSDRTVPGADGAPEVPVRLYTPDAPSARPRGVLVFFHGGGYVFGEISDFDAVCAEIVKHVDCVVGSVGYRLAPEHPYPAAVHDAYAALVWVAGNAAELGVDPARIAIGGVSAGAGLAAALALYARDHGGPATILQVLDNPMIDDEVDTPSARAFTDTPLWTGPQARLGWRFYLGPHADAAAVSPYAAPSRATDLGGLPPAYITANEFDPLRDEALEYALRLLQAGVPVELHHRPGTFHGSNTLPGAEISARARADMYAALRRALTE